MRNTVVRHAQEFKHLRKGRLVKCVEVVRDIGGVSGVLNVRLDGQETGTGEVKIAMHLASAEVVRGNVCGWVRGEV